GRRQARRFSEFVYAPLSTSLTTYGASKSNARRVAEETGVRLPRLYAEFPSYADIALSGLPDRFVLKSDILSSRKGVYLMLRQGDGYHDLFTKRTFTEAELRDDLEGRVQGWQGTILAEEFVRGENGDGIPFDYKMYTFEGVVRHINQVNRNTDPPSIVFFDGDFEPVEPHRIARLSHRMQPGKPVRPANWEQLLETAGRIARHIDAPFVRVDTYTTGDDVVLGELTLRPGGFYRGLWQLADELDVELGTYYSLAYRRRGLPIPIVEGLPPVLKEAAKAERASRDPGIMAASRLLARALGRKLKGSRKRKRGRNG
ncbi:MAG TPA: ATP-grasp fold amidoligase family protein, partial [Devosia sp.]|nr:ATP-grasp fold amidoligase family protein [Devosia sp.]